MLECEGKGVVVKAWEGELVSLAVQRPDDASVVAIDVE